VEEAIAKFLRLSTNDPPVLDAPADAVANLTIISSLSQQQRRLAEKLKERLGYLGVYYKRNPANFLRHMTPSERQELLERLKDDYRKIILEYFSSKAGQSDRINQAIDIFVNLAFFSDVSVSQIVEIHIELMDEFSKQLKLEGRSDDILQDYRLTLIDVIAHLCEMYRRSIPREA
jgi:circadian clock protein KaiA